MDARWFVVLDQKRSSYSVLAGLLGIGAAAGVLYMTGTLGWAVGLFSRAVRWGVRAGFRTWEVCLSWADWPVFVAATVALLAVGGLLAGAAPPADVGCGLAAAAMGVTTCLA